VLLIVLDLAGIAVFAAVRVVALVRGWDAPLPPRLPDRP
jgi:hypothetical protein